MSASPPPEWSKASSNLDSPMSCKGKLRKLIFSEAHGSDPDDERAFEYLWGLVSRQELRFLLHDEEQWRTRVKEDSLSRAEEDALCELLSYLEIDRIQKEEDPLQQEWEQLFLKEFPGMKKEMEERIRKLHALADKVEKTHRDCTISNVVSGSAGVASSILSICGLALAPVTAGVSLSLTIAGLGLGAAAEVTRVSTSIVDHTSKSFAKAKASKLLSMDGHVNDILDAVFKDISQLCSTTKKCMKKFRDMEVNIRAFQLVQRHPRLVASARRLMTNGNISVQREQQVQKAFGGTALAMTKGARVTGLVTSSVFLLVNVINLVQESKHLHEGAQEVCAQELRGYAQELEQKLEELTQAYESLRRR